MTASNVIPINQVEILDSPLKPKSDEECLREEIGEEKANTAIKICEQLSCNLSSIYDIAAEITGKNGKTAARDFYCWRIRSAALSRIYARACASRAHVMAHSIYDEVMAEPDPVKARVIMDTRKWQAARFNRTEFGDDPPQPGVNVTINNNDMGTQVLDEIRQRLARKRKQMKALEGQKSMLTVEGGGVVSEGGGEG